MTLKGGKALKAAFPREFSRSKGMDKHVLGSKVEKKGITKMAQYIYIYKYKAWLQNIQRKLKILFLKYFRGLVAKYIYIVT